MWSPGSKVATNTPTSSIMNSDFLLGAVWDVDCSLALLTGGQAMQPSSMHCRSLRCCNCYLSGWLVRSFGIWPRRAAAPPPSQASPQTQWRPENHVEKETHNEPNKSNGAKTVASGGLAVVDDLPGGRHPRHGPIGQRHLNRIGEGLNRRKYLRRLS